MGILAETIAIIFDLVVKETYLLNSWPTFGHLESTLPLVASMDDLRRLVIDFFLGVTKNGQIVEHNNHPLQEIFENTTDNLLQVERCWARSLEHESRVSSVFSDRYLVEACLLRDIKQLSYVGNSSGVCR
jgi:hypothetical protein